MAIALKIDTGTGRLAQLLAADTLDIDQIEPRSGGNLVIGSTLGAADELRLGVSGEVTRNLGDLIVDENLTVTGNLIVDGTVTSVDSETVLIADNHLYLNQNYETNSAQTGGLVVNYLPTATTDTVAATGFTAGVPATSNPTVSTTGAATFSVGQFIQISGANEEANNGLFEVLSHAANVLTIRGVGTTAEVEDFTQNQFVTDTTVAGSIVHVNIAVMRAGTDGIWETAVGNTTTLSFSDIGSGAGNSLQQAYVQGNTIDVTSAEGIIDFANDTAADTTTVLSVSRTPGSSTGGIGLDVSLGANTTGTAVQINQAGSGLALDVQDGGSSVLQATGAGAVSITPTSGQNATITAAGAGIVDINSGADIDVDATGDVLVDAAGVSLDATAASNFTITASSAGAEDLVLSSTNAGAGTGNVLVSADDEIDLTSTGLMDLNAGANLDIDVTGTFDMLSTGAFSIDGTGSSNVSIATGDLTLDATAGELILQDTGNFASGAGTLSQTGDRDFSQTAAGEVLNGATSLIGAINRIAEAMDLNGQAAIRDYVVENGVTITAGDTVAQGSVSGRATQANANGDAQAEFIGIALETGTGDVGGTVSVRVALPGNFVSVSGASFTAGNALFVPDGTGQPTGTAPSGTGDVVLRVGWAHSATEFVIDPGPAVVL